MFKYMIMFVLLTPLIGISLVEDGAYAASVGKIGMPNGATTAFGAYVLGVVVVTLIAMGPRRDLSMVATVPRISAIADDECFQFSLRLLLLITIYIMAMLFMFGGIHVWLGTLEKGMFRTNLGPFGAIPYAMTKFIIPALFAYSTMLQMRIKHGGRCKWLWRLNALLIIIAGSTWGFKTTGMFMLLPGLLILNWKMSLNKAALLAAAFFASLVVFFFVFDAELMDGVNVFQFLVERLTVLQGDVSWYVWGQYIDGIEFPNYFPSLLAGFGDSIIGTFVDKGNFFEWMGFHYDWMLTYIAVGSEEAIIHGHSVTGTPFSEGIIAGGWMGIAIFAIIAGLLIGRMYRILSNAIENGRANMAALLSTYFCFHIFAWLNGGAITQLFHISVLANLLLSYALIKLMRHQPRLCIPDRA
ncbi:hypothetical protein ABGV49_05910 [Chromobacterium vaccinii]|uniref:Oligosaccharide repeat unit polymerase n=1 Tax=Chromobacterium vaccinii TaxID=1108595 RepID=A0ABV0FBI7_9NEIS